MCSNVFIKIAWIGKWFKTFFTSKWLLSWMSPTMGFKISWWRKWLVTFFTSIWLLSRMGSYVSFKFGWLRKWFGTFFTNKWVLTWIGSEVCLKIVWHWESPWTIFTNEWFLSWMCLLRLPESENDLKHSLQVRPLSPFSSTVGFKFGWLRKWFGTFFKNKWPLSWMCS